MNRHYNPSQEYEFDLIDLFWKLLMQWKVILIFCIAMALLVMGGKYHIDSKEYEAALSERAEAEKEAQLPESERIAKIIEELPGSDASTVQYIIHLQESIADLERYLDNSIILNADPARQRNINIKYFLQKGEVADMQTLADAYSTCMRRAKVIKEFRDIISPDSPLEYIYELVTTWTGNIVDSSVKSTLFSVNIVLPEGVSAEEVIRESDIAIERIKKEITPSLGEHSIERVNTEDYRAYIASSTDRRTNISYAINNLNNNLKTAKDNLTEQQQTALDAIDAVNKSSAAIEKGADITQMSATKAPEFNKTYAILGFIFGALLYAICFLIASVLKKTISSASVAQNYTGSRLLGELYVLGDQKGIKKLFSSKAVSKKRYKDKLDIDAQTESTAASLDAVCTHHNTEKLALLTSHVSEELKDILYNVVKKCGSNGRNIELILIDADNLDEKVLSLMDNVAFALSNEAKVYDVGRLSNLCRDYEITKLGTLYLEML